MPIEKISATQFDTQISTGITDRTKTHDTAFGPIKDVVIRPMANVLERQNDRIRQVSLLVSLINSGEFTDADLDALVFNESLTRIQGARATGTVTFSTTQVDTQGPDLVVQRGFPIATIPDSSTNTAVTYVTSESKTLPMATASSFFNLDTNKFELEVAVIAVIEGSAGRVGTGRINRPLRPLVGFTEVSNTTATDGGRDAETNAELIDRYLLAILGREIATPLGVNKFLLDEFPEIVDVLTVFGNNALLTRTSEDAGGVDAYTVGETLKTLTENIAFLGINQTLPVLAPPLRSVLDVRVGATVYTENVDYEVVDDTSANAGSTRAVDGVRFLPDDGVSPAPPSSGDVVTIQYTSNDTVRLAQAALDADDAFVFGRDLLVKEGVQVAVVLDAQLRVTAGFNTATVTTAVSNAVTGFINALKLGADVEESDIQGEVRRVTGVDNFIITRLVRDATLTGASDLIIADNEFARIAVTDLSITVI